MAVHALLDGRDTPPQSALGYLDQFERDIQGCGRVTIATVGGRYFGMDRDKRWDRVSLAYNAIVEADAPRAGSAAPRWRPPMPTISPTNSSSRP